jgi:hypothetical protein
MRPSALRLASRVYVQRLAFRFWGFELGFMVWGVMRARSPPEELFPPRDASERVVSDASERAEVGIQGYGGSVQRLGLRFRD